MKELLLHVVRSLKAVVAAEMETLDYKNKNAELAKDIFSRMTSQLYKNSRQKPRKF
jgi:hypothetical protein